MINLKDNELDSKDKHLEILVEEDLYGNCINREEKIDIILCLADKEVYNLYTDLDEHHVIKQGTTFYNKTYYTSSIFYYKEIEAVYNEKNDLIRETTKNVDGKITKEILCDYKFDEFGNKIYKSINTKIDNKYKENIDKIYIYKNKYHENGKIVKKVKMTEDKEIVYTKEYKYKDNRLDSIQTCDSKGYIYETSYFYYKDDENYEEEIYSFGELSCYNKYVLVKDNRYKKTY